MVGLFLLHLWHFAYDMKPFRIFLLGAFFSLLVAGVGISQTPEFLFKSGEDGYQCFRIPAIITTQSGTLLAFAEGRKKDCGDAGDIDLVLKRSEDQGKTWSALQVVWSDSANTCGNPAPVLDARTGNIVLLSTWNLGADHEWQIINGSSQNTRRVYVLTSTDEGRSWSAPREITTAVKQPNWTWYATGPVNGIQIRQGKYKGRLVIPCDHIEAGSKQYYSHTIHSDDGGQNWQLGGSTPTDQVNECTVAELSKGNLILNMRNYNQQRIRQTAISADGGHTWSALRGDTSLVEPVCQASLIRLYQQGRKPVLAFSNPAHAKQRVNMTVRLSYDEGQTWSRSLVLHQGPAAYSNLVELGRDQLACLFEAGEKHAYEGILFRLIGMQEFR